MDNIWTKVIQIALHSLKSNDIPVGAVIIRNNKVIGKGYNTREKDQNVLGHAEINAIKNAQKKLKNWNLGDCELYVSLKPCSMCNEIIKQCRIKKVYYLLEKPTNKLEYNKTENIKESNEMLEVKYAEILSNFFAKLREKKD